jgi:spermidine synthase
VTRRWPIVAIFVLSGAAGLIYEVVWARQLVLVFGNTTQAVSAILTGFFGGMAIGSAFGGRIGDRVRRPLRMYGLLEVILVVVVLATPVTFRLLHEVYRGAFGTLETAPTLLALVRFGLSLLALGPATILMGATLPTLTRYLSRDPSDLSGAFSRLYAANTIGAIAGTVAAGFVLIELLGLTGTLVVGVVCSGTAGLAALLLDRSRAASNEPAAPVVVAPAPEVASTAGSPSTIPRPRLRLALSLAFVSGLTSLAYQVLWTRLLASGTGNSTYVFSTILAVFLTGLALGAVAYAWLRPRLRDVLGLLAIGQFAVAILVAIGMASVVTQGHIAFLNLTTHFDLLISQYLWPVVIVVMPATFMMGLTFPATSSLVADPDGHISTNAGTLLATNTVGAIVGTFIVPFVVIPAVGSPTALGLIAIVNALTGVALALSGNRGHAVSRVVASAIGGVIAFGLLAALVGGQVFVDPSAAHIRYFGGQVDASAEDEIASVQAGDVGGFKQLWVTGSSMTVLTVDAKLMPILPLMLNTGSTNELTVAFGMGTAYRTSLITGMRTQVIELVPSVPLMFPIFYPDAEQVLADPNGQVTIADGRNHVELTDKTYDIIVVDPPPPVESSGVSVISSFEFYQASRARLNPGGVMMQWVPFGQSIDEFRAHVRTFRAVFPNVIVLRGQGGYGFYMLGSDSQIGFSEPAMRSVLRRPGVLADIDSLPDARAHTEDEWVALIPSLVVLSGDQVSAFAGDEPLITDDHPLPEYFLLRHTFGPRSPQLSPGLVHAP